MAKKPRQTLRIGPLVLRSPLPPNDEHRTAAESSSFEEMLKHALDG